MKVEREADMYCLWSIRGDGPVAWGTKAEVEQYLTEDIDRELAEERQRRIDAIPERFRRADDFGSSDRMGSGWWGISMVMPQGTLERPKMREFLESYDEPSDLFDFTLLEPHEDD